MTQENTGYIDLEGGLARVRGNKKLFGRMLGMFLASEEFDKLEQALAAGDYAAAGDVAHAIKGVTGNLSLTLLFELSTALMNQLRQGPPDPETLEQYRAALPETRARVEAVMAELAAEG